MNKRRSRVLLVGEDKLMRDKLKSILAANEFAVAGEATDGKTAIEFCRRVMPDVVCLDVNLPGDGGLETLKALRRHHPAAPVVMINADASLNAVRDAVSHGAAGYIIKPFSEGNVVNTLKRISLRAQ
jgi:two-component system chemotaxis response regulator CheY